MATGPIGATGPTGANGATGPTGATGATGAIATNQNAQFLVNATSLTNNTLIPFSNSFTNGSDITFPAATSISLAAGHVYSVTFLVRATVALAGSIAVTPQVNAVSQPDFATSATTTLTGLTVSVSATFLVNTLATSAATVGLLYSATLLANSPVGVVTVTEIQ